MAEGRPERSIARTAWVRNLARPVRSFVATEVDSAYDLDSLKALVRATLAQAKATTTRGRDRSTREG